MKVIIFLFLVIVSFVFLLRIKFSRNSRQFSTLLGNFFSKSKSIEGQGFSFSQIETLPAPVQRYFRLVLKEGQPYISYVRLLHNGYFKTSLKKNWISIKGKQYFTIKTPGFIWQGTTTFFTARDMFMNGEGSLVVSIMSLYNIIDSKGPDFNKGELLRWLGESVWFPTNLLPSEKLTWTAIDDFSANLEFTYKDLKLKYKVKFNTKGEITELETKRFMDKDHLETWIAKISDYKKLNDILIPTNIEVSWRLAGKDFSYARFFVKEIEYDVPKEW